MLITFIALCFIIFIYVLNKEGWKSALRYLGLVAILSIVLLIVTGGKP